MIISASGVDPDLIDQLVAFGFEASVAARALTKFKGNIEQAANALFNGEDVGTADDASGADPFIGWLYKLITVV